MGGRKGFFRLPFAYANLRRHMSDLSLAYIWKKKCIRFFILANELEFRQEKYVYADENACVEKKNVKTDKNACSDIST